MVSSPDRAAIATRLEPFLALAPLVHQQVAVTSYATVMTCRLAESSTARGSGWAGPVGRDNFNIDPEVTQLEAVSARGIRRIG